MDVDAYLTRINYHGPLAPSVESLRALHRAHMLSVPFENLDIPLGNKITTSVHSIYDKIVVRKRGGFCYELNGLFAWLLEEIGFKVTMHSARVCEGKDPGPEFDHLVLQVHLDDRWLADVGFGDSFLEPISMERFPELVQYNGSYRLSRRDEEWSLLRQQPGSNWEPQYLFTLIPHRFEEFSEMCEYHQTSPNSSFTQKQVCSMATENGRITLSDTRLIVTDKGAREERELDGIDEYRRVLKEYFGVEIEGVEKLFSD